MKLAVYCETIKERFFHTDQPSELITTAFRKNAVVNCKRVSRVSLVHAISPQACGCA